jgi:F-type H+-transporting ATPase subunit b
MEGGPFAINPGVAIWTLVVFLLLLVVLWKTAWPAILKAVEERERQIQAQLDAAAKANEEAQRLLAEHEKQVAGARAEAQAILAAGRQAGERIREDIQNQARAEHEQLLARARREIQVEREAAVSELRREAIELSIAAAGKVIERNLDTDADRKLVLDYLATLRAGQA